MSALDATALPGATFGGLIHTKHGAAALTAAASCARVQPQDTLSMYSMTPAASSTRGRPQRSRIFLASGGGSGVASSMP